MAFAATMKAGAFESRDVMSPHARTTSADVAPR